MKLEKQLILNTRPTLNGRMYPLKVLEQIRDQINSNDPSINIGTLGYPEGLDISLTDAAFTYTNAVIENDCLYVDIQILSTPDGEKIKHQIEVDQRVGVSSRVFRPAGQASLEGELSDSHRMVCDDYKIITIASILNDEDAIQTNEE